MSECVCVCVYVSECVLCECVRGTDGRAAEAARAVGGYTDLH